MQNGFNFLLRATSSWISFGHTLVRQDRTFVSTCVSRNIGTAAREGPVFREIVTPADGEALSHFGSGYARLGFRVSDFGFPPLPACGFVLTAALRISCVDTPGKKKRESGPWGGLYFEGCRNVLWYHGRSMVVPYCYSVPRLRNLPFSLLRMLILRRWSFGRMGVRVCRPTTAG